ncbi:MAG: hypothetical protein HY352_03325 [Candidatus Omnitrophica bacterium]|nr:hypothetical protein [Candidatus Omnitrophota bacterium]
MRSTARLWETFAVVAMLGTASGVCLAAEEVGDPAKPLQASGVIASVDALGGVLTVKESTHLDPVTGTAAQPTSYLVDAKTVVSKDKQPLTLADLRVGDAVTVEYATKDGKNVASSITIQLPTAASSGSATSTAKPAAASY